LIISDPNPLPWHPDGLLQCEESLLIGSYHSYEQAVVCLPVHTLRFFGHVQLKTTQRHSYFSQESLVAAANTATAALPLTAGYAEADWRYAASGSGWWRVACM